MSEWQEAVNLMQSAEKKKKVRKKSTKKPQIGLRCWQCGLYIDNLKSSNYCTECVIKHLKKLGYFSSQEKIEKNLEKSIEEEPEDN
jgi:hypothetical protein